MPDVFANVFSAFTKKNPNPNPNPRATASTPRLDRLTSLGFSVAEARLALEHTNGDVDQAAVCLLAKRRQEASAGLANRANAILRTQRPWPEFFERFLWPEHLQERLGTNLVRQNQTWFA